MSTPEPRDFINEDLSGQDLSGQSFADCHFESTNLSGANLSGCDFTDASFSDVDLSWADLSGCNFSGAYFFGEVVFTDTQMINCNLYNALFEVYEAVTLVECRLSWTLFRYNIPLFTSCIWENTNYYFMDEDEIRPTNVPDNLTVVEFGNLMALDFSGLSHPSILDSLLDMWLGISDISVAFYSDKTRWPEGFDPNQYPDLIKAESIGPNINLIGRDLSAIPYSVLENIDFTNCIYDDSTIWPDDFYWDFWDFFDRWEGKLIKIDSNLRSLDLGEVNLENVSWTKTTIYNEYTKWPKDFDPSQHPNLLKIEPNMSLRGFDFTNTGVGLLRYQNFSGFNLSQANFSSIDLEEASFQGANLMGTNFSGAKLPHSWDCPFDQAVYNNHTVWPDNFPESSKKHMIFVTSGAQLPDVNLTATVLKDLDLSNIDLSNADLGGATFENIDLSGACLIDANIANTTFKNVSVTQTTILPRGMRFDNLPEGWVIKGLRPKPRANHCFVVPDHIASIIAKLSDDDQTTLNSFIQELGGTQYRYLVMLLHYEFDQKFRSTGDIEKYVFCHDETIRDITKCRLILESSSWTVEHLWSTIDELSATIDRLEVLYQQGTSNKILSPRIAEVRDKLQATISTYRRNDKWTITRRGDLDKLEYKAIHIDLDELRANQQS